MFASKPSDMPGIHPSVNYQKFAIFPKAKPVSQKERKMGEERHKVVREEMDKLLNANFIKEVKYSIWLANVEMHRFIISCIGNNKTAPPSVL